MEKPDIVVVGSCMKDLVCYVSSFPAPGETVSCHKFETGFGGKGANQCVMAAKLGATAVMVAKVGDDDIGTATLENLSAHNICTDHVQRVTGIASGVASIAVNQSGENTIIIAPGANECMDTAVLDSARDVIQNAKVVVCQLEIPPPTVKAALLLAKQNGVRTIFNPAPAVNGLDETIYSVSDIVCLNETEVSFLFAGLLSCCIVVVFFSPKLNHAFSIPCVRVERLHFTWIARLPWGNCLHVTSGICGLCE
eukprot:scpid87770/ scgid0131/ Ribokinase